jgi:hypothetical protein
MLASPSGFADDVGQILTLSVADRFLVALTGSFLGLLAGPAEALLEDLSDMFGVECNLELASDQFGNPSGGPQFRPPAVVLGTLLEKAFESLELSRIEPRPWPGMGLGSEFLDGLSGELHPGVDGGASAAEEMGDLVGGLALGDEFNGSDAATLKF